MDEKQADELLKTLLDGLGAKSAALIFDNKEDGLRTLITGNHIWLMGALDYTKRQIFIQASRHMEKIVGEAIKPKEEGPTEPPQ